MPRLQNPKEIRNLLATDAARVTDPQLLALVLARGSNLSRGRASQGRTETKTSWNAIELAEALYAEAGWRLPELARRTLAGELELATYGVGPAVGGVLVAALELGAKHKT